MKINISIAMKQLTTKVTNTVLDRYGIGEAIPVGLQTHEINARKICEIWMWGNINGLS